MGVESKFYILPETSTYRPDTGAVLNLVRALRSAEFLCDPDSPKFAAEAHRWGPSGAGDVGEGFFWRTGRERIPGALVALDAVLDAHAQADLVITWPNSDLARSGLKYPLSQVPGEQGVYYDLELHLVRDTAYHTSEIIDPFEEIRCPCGAELEELDAPPDDPLYDSRLPNACPACLAPMDYSRLPMTVRDAGTGEPSDARGGITYRFAVVVDCGKYWPELGATVTEEFLSIIRRTLGIKPCVWRDFY